MTAPDVSVVVPTHDRCDQLQKTLAALSGQTYPGERIEVVVVDDGSTDGTLEMVAELGRVVYIRQSNQGATSARNAGAARARARLLVFVDDDVELAPEALASLVDAHRAWPDAVVVGRLDTPAPAYLFQLVRAGPESADSGPDGEIPFTHCCGGLLSVGRAEFRSLGGFQDPTGGRPSWDDVDFGYRAHAKGLRLVCATSARGIHRCDWAASVEETARRWYEASRSAVRLFQRHPGVERSFPFYRDKLPIGWGRDSWPLVARKLARSLISSRAVLRGIERTTLALAAGRWPPRLMRSLVACVISGYQWQGIRRGIEEHGPIVRERPAR